MGDHPFRSLMTWVLLVAGPMVFAERETTSGTMTPIRRLSDFWAMTAVDRESPREVDLEVDILYYDPEWRVLHVQDESLLEYIDVEEPLALRAGDRVRVTGMTRPVAQTFAIGDAEWEVFGQTVLAGPLINPAEIEAEVWMDRFVTLEGLIESQELLDEKHLEVRLIVGNDPVTVWVMLAPEEPVPQLEGQIARVSGVFAPKFATGAEILQLELFCPGVSRIEVLGPLQTYAKFELPLTKIDTMTATPDATGLVRVQGHRTGALESNGFWLRDQTGQIWVEGARRQSPSEEAVIEVVGKPQIVGIERRLTQALWREVPALGEGDEPAITPVSLHRLAATVMELEPAQAALGHPVNITGVVTWSQTGMSRFFVQDSSGGVAAEWSDALGDVPENGQLVNIVGITQFGEFAPIIKVQECLQQGRVYMPRADSIRWEHAMMGLAEAQWVKMTGFVFAAQREGEFTRLSLSMVSGELTARISALTDVAGLVGSVVTLSGVCVADADDARRLQGVELWVPDLGAVEVIDSGATDHFAHPITPLDALGRFNRDRSFRERIHTVGTVLHWDDTGRIYVGNEDVAMRAQSRQVMPLRRGDVVNLVGFQGRESNRVVLREVIYRKTAGQGVLPSKQFRLGDDLTVAGDSTLVEIEGTLVERVEQPDETHLTLRNGSEVFMVEVSGGALNQSVEELVVGSLLNVTGVFVANFDDEGNRVGFRVLSSSGRDIELIQAPSWWSPARVTFVVIILVGLVMLTLIWVRLLKRRVRLQTIKLEQHMRRATELEADLQRTSRMESLGSLAEGIARDFDDLLNRIKTQTGKVMDGERLSVRGRQELDQARAAVLRAEDLTRRLASLSLARTPELAGVDLSAFLRREVDAFEVGPAIKIIWNMPETAPEILADRVQLREVIYNVLLNAVQAMPSGGIIKILLQPEMVKKESKDSRLTAGPYLRFTVRDNGEGVAITNLDRVFDPYFTTRPGAKGLGLSVVYAIMRQHEGRVTLESSPMGGTEVSVWFRVDSKGSSASPFNSESESV